MGSGPTCPDARPPSSGRCEAPLRPPLWRSGRGRGATSAFSFVCLLDFRAVIRKTAILLTLLSEFVADCSLGFDFAASAMLREDYKNRLRRDGRAPRSRPAGGTGGGVASPGTRQRGSTRCVLGFGLCSQPGAHQVYGVWRSMLSPLSKLNRSKGSGLRCSSLARHRILYAPTLPCAVPNRPLISALMPKDRPGRGGAGRGGGHRHARIN